MNRQSSAGNGGRAQVRLQRPSGVAQAGSTAAGRARIAVLRLLAPFGLCVAGLTAPAFAQSVTAEDAKAALAKAQAANIQAETALAAANRAIEEAKAAIKPASAFAHLPPDTLALEGYLGESLVSVDSGYLMVVGKHNSGSLMITLHNLDGSLAGTFLLGAPQATATSDVTLHELAQTGFAHCAPNAQPRAAGLKRDGSGVHFGWSCGGNRRGEGAVHHSYTVQADGPGIRTRYMGFTLGSSDVSSDEHQYLPMTQEVLTAAAEKARERYEEEQRRQQVERLERERQLAVQRQREAEQRDARNARWGQVMGALNGALDAGLEVARAQEAQSRYELDRTLAGINAQLAAQRAAEAQEQTQRHAEQQGVQQQVAQSHGEQQELARQQAARRDAQPQIYARPAQSASGTGSWETAGGPPSMSASQASTRDRADSCISPPVTSRHQCGSMTGHKGIVSNSCPEPVDVRMCFMTDSGWNCQRRDGLGPEQSWEPGWCHANTGEVFHSVRYSDSSEPLASP